ncbi:MAG TPA: hypothetical protein DDZ90_05520 [Planctomycetaceae bacterium]|nr:hypothetical protein [Gimesia sp.]HBL42835.1 hypothetical protein [Planctomycetaceae bacterium]
MAPKYIILPAMANIIIIGVNIFLQFFRQTDPTHIRFLRSAGSPAIRNHIAMNELRKLHTQTHQQGLLCFHSKAFIIADHRIDFHEAPDEE